MPECGALVLRLALIGMSSSAVTFLLAVLTALELEGVRLEDI